MRKAGQYPQRYEEGFAPFLERVRHVNIMSKFPFFYVDVPNNVSQGTTSPTHKYGILACEDPLQQSPFNIWIVLVPKYLTNHEEQEGEDTLRDSVCPSYAVGDPLFVGRLADPLYVGHIDKNGEKIAKDRWNFKDKVFRNGTAFYNTHPFITNAKEAYSSVTSAVSTGKQKTGYDPKLFAYYIDLNVDGRTRCAGGDVVQTGESAPNVWL